MRENCTYGSMRGRAYPMGALRSTLHPSDGDDFDSKAERFAHRSQKQRRNERTTKTNKCTGEVMLVGAELSGFPDRMGCELPIDGRGGMW